MSEEITPSPQAGPEFPHVIDLRYLEEKPLELIPDAAQRAALARRFSLVSIHAMQANLTLVRDGQAVVAKGRLRAQVVQSCAVSAEDLPTSIDEPLHLRFLPESALEAQEEQELSAEDCDEIFYEGTSFDLGEAVAQSLALAIDPFAVGPEAEKVRASGLLGAENTSPFAALAALKPKE